MTYVVVENCIKCKYTDCVEVCPVDCFYEGENMLVIHPDECIDCGVCEPECPAEAIKPDTSSAASRNGSKLNLRYGASNWPNLTKKRDRYRTLRKWTARTASWSCSRRTPAKATKLSHLQFRVFRHAGVNYLPGTCPASAGIH